MNLECMATSAWAPTRLRPQRVSLCPSVFNYGDLPGDDTCKRMQVTLPPSSPNHWQMRFNVDKCKVMHLGAKNMHASYILGGVELGGSVVEKDLGVLVDHKLNDGMQCQAAVSKASKVLSCIKRGTDSRDRDIILPLYKSLLRPHLEYAVQFWAPVLKKDIGELEKVQKRAT